MHNPSFHEQKSQEPSRTSCNTFLPLDTAGQGTVTIRNPGLACHYEDCLEAVHINKHGTHSLKRETVHLTGSCNNFLCFYTQTLGSSLPALRSGAILGSVSGLILQETERWCMVLSDMDKGEHALLPGKETTAQGVWEGVSQYLCPQQGWTPALPAPGMLIIWVSCLFHCSKADWYRQLKLHFFMGQFGVVASSQAEFRVGFVIWRGLETPHWQWREHLCHTDPLTMLTRLAGALWRVFLLCFVFSCCRSTNFLGPIRVTAAKA